MLARAFISAFCQLKYKSLRRVVWAGLIGSAVILVLSAIAVSLILFMTDIFVFDGILSFLNPVVDLLIDLLGLTVIIIVSWFLFPSLASLIVSLFLEEVAVAIETKHFSSLPSPRNQDKGEIFVVTVKFVTISLILNILVFPVYAILIFLGPFNLFIYYGLNGYLIGREFFEIVAHRRLLPARARDMRRKVKGQLFLTGVIIAFLMTIPVVNFVAPVIAVAAMVYLVNGWVDVFETLKKDRR